MRNLYTLLVVCLLVLAGCGAGVTPSAPITTAIPPGIYTGEVTRTDRTTIGGVEEVSSVTEPLTTVIEEHGLPLVGPTDDVPVEGLTTTLEVGGFVFRSTITSVTSSGNRLVINSFMELTLEDLVMIGTLTSTYEFIPPDTLELIGQSSAVGMSDTLGPASFDTTTTATLTR